MKKIVDIMDSAINQLNEVKGKLHDHSEDNMAINIIIDDSDPRSPLFVEIETDGGKSIRIGEEMTTEEGYRRLRINTADIIQHEAI